MFSLAGETFKVAPTITEGMLLMGEHYRGQRGTGYLTLNGDKLAFQLEFERLTRAEAAVLKRMARAPEGSPYSEIVMVDRDRIFDGATDSAEYDRVLNRVKITASDFRPIQGHYDNNTDLEANLSLESATITVEEV